MAGLRSGSRCKLLSSAYETMRLQHREDAVCTHPAAILTGTLGHLCHSIGSLSSRPAPAWDIDGMGQCVLRVGFSCIKLRAEKPLTVSPGVQEDDTERRVYTHRNRQGP